MFDSLTERLGQTLRDLQGVGRLTEDNIKGTLREVRMALLEADVALPVVRKFVGQVREQALGEKVMKSLTPGQMLIKILNDELVNTMGRENEGLLLNAAPPVAILMAGLQGSGKTTTVAKLARWLKESQKKTVLVASADIYRPAAIDQLMLLAKEVGVDFFPNDGTQNPIKIAESALRHARVQHHDVLILDTAGRLHIDDEMMAEIQQLHNAITPLETLFVVDSMTGQDAANTAKAFNEALSLTGVVLTKTDGDARGGAALSIRHITGKPIKFLGVGEKTSALEPFSPERVASRILGKGDVLSLVEQAQQTIDQDKAEKLVRKIKKGKGFDLEDFLEQLQQVKNMGGLTSMLEKLPGLPGIPDTMKDQVNDKQISRQEAIIYSMTSQERHFPAIIRGSRKRRIAAGSGTQVQDVNRLLKQFTQMKKMMKKMHKGGMQELLRGLSGRMPSGH